MHLHQLSDVALLLEWAKWNCKIREAKQWGAAVSVASEFRKECEQEIYRRNKKIENVQS